MTAFETSDTLQPLEENRARWPQHRDGEAYPEVLDKTTGTDGDSWLHARGYVQASMDKVWEALRDINVVTDRHHIDTWYKDGDCSDPYLDHCFLFYNLVREVLTIEYIVTWKHQLQSHDDGERVDVRYQKTWGSTFINTMRGSFVLEPVDSQTTRLEYVGHFKAFTANGESVLNEFIDDVYEDVVQFSHDRALN